MRKLKMRIMKRSTSKIDELRASYS